MADAIKAIADNNNWTPSISPEAMAAASKKKKNSIDMQSFLKIMAAQMQNQSLSGSGSGGSDNSQYVTEMALFTAVQSIDAQTAEASKQYAASLVGSNVVINTTDKSTGKAKQISGMVLGTLFNDVTGDNYIQVGKDTYDVSSVVGSSGSGATRRAAMSYLMTARQYAMSLVGKNVVVDTKDSDGKDQKVTGIVKSVAFDPMTDAATLTMTRWQNLQCRARSFRFSLTAILRKTTRHPADLTGRRTYERHTIQAELLGTDFPGLRASDRRRNNAGGEKDEEHLYLCGDAGRGSEKRRRPDVF